MARHSNATREEKSHTINDSLKRRARSLVTNSSIPGQTRSLIRYALEIKDPDLAQLVRRVEAGEMSIDHVQAGVTPETLCALCVFAGESHREPHRRREADYNIAIDERGSSR